MARYRRKEDERPGCWGRQPRDRENPLGPGTFAGERTAFQIAYYRLGLVECPVVASDHLEPFLEAEIPDLWTYYCCVQGVDVSNRFFAMPSGRNRILGVQLYLYRMQGFLQWGYNFYNTRFSLQHIDSFAVTDSGESFPSGDAFLVYPGPGGQPLSSIRLEVLRDAMEDIRALEALEKYAFLFRLRERVHREISLRSEGRAASDDMKV